MRIQRVAQTALVVVAFGALLLAAASCTSDQEKLNKYLAEAAQYRKSQQYDEAYQSLRQALKLDPKNAQINLQLAETLKAMHRPRDAGFYYGEAYRLDPKLSEAALAMAPLLYETERDQARAVVEKVLKRDPQNHMAYLRKAEIALLDSDTAAALTAALTCERLAPDKPESHRIVGTVYTAMAKERNLKREPPDPEIYAKALAAYKRADEIVGKSWMDRNSIAELYGIWKGHEEDAEKEWHDAFDVAKQAGDKEGMRLVATTAAGWGTRARRPEVVRWALEKSVEVDPDRLRVRRQLAAVAEREKEGGGERIWRDAVAEEPNDPLVHVALARYLANHGREEEALQHLESLPAGVPDSPEVDLLRVEIYTVRGDSDKARAVLTHMQQSHASDPLTAFAAARIDLADGHVDKAATALRTLSVSLQRPDVLRLLATVERARGNYRQALAAVNKAIEISPMPDRGLYELRHSNLRALGDWDGLLQSIHEMQAAHLRLQLGDALQLVEANYALGRNDRGRRQLERLLKIDPPPLAVVIAWVRFEGKKDPDRALKLLEGAQKQYPNNGAVVRAMALTELAAGRPQRALERLDTLGPPEKQSPKVRLLRGQVLVQLKRLPEAEAEARAVFESRPRPPAAAGLLAQVLRAEGERDEAIKILEQAHAQHDLSGQDLWLLGSLYLAGNDLAHARTVLEEAVSASPGLQLARNDLAFVLAQTKDDLPRALDLAREARSALPNSPAVADTLGWVYYQRGMMEPAVSEFRNASQLASDRTDKSLRAEIHYHTGLALQALGKKDEALHELDEALALEPQHEGARKARAKISARASKPSEGS